ncbi:Elongation factor Ts, mitochondrial [Tulasnella sp. 403]|nr:Elongation factor Ts, mitochondrial [Tulasnella sp. 403]
MLPPSLLHRLYSTSPSQSVKASVKLIAEIRKRVAGTSLTKAREALEATNNSLEDALSWLEKDIPTSGAAKAAKLQGRSTKEGLIALAILSHGGWKDRHPQGVRAAMVELNCETDFVSRNDLFVQLAHDISHTVAYITDPTPDATLKHSTELFKHLSLDMISDAPVVPTSPFASCSPSSTVATIGESIRNSVAKLGEKISLRRACTFVTEPLADKALGLVASSPDGWRH